MPVLVCLTHGDLFYAEHITEDGEYPSKEVMQHAVGKELSVSVSRMQPYLIQMIELLLISVYPRTTKSSRETRNPPRL